MSSRTRKAGTILQSEVAKVTEENFKRKLEFARTEAKAAGRNVDAITLGSTAFVSMFNDSPEASKQTAAGIGGMFGIPGEQVLRMPLALIGKPDECAAELKRPRPRIGVSHYIVSGFGRPVYAERFAKKVLPKV
jgi:hypothetical protein